MTTKEFSIRHCDGGLNHKWVEERSQEFHRREHCSNCGLEIIITMSYI